MSTSNFKDGFYALAMVSLGFFLSGCTESTNIAASGSSGVSSCSSLLGVTCVNGRFIDEAVENLDYECGLANAGTVKSKTDVDGSFSCPNNSVAIFSLINPNDPDQKVILGQVKIRRPADIYAEGSPSLYFNVTPYMLAGGPNNITSPQRAENIARLLQTMNRDATSDELPSHSIKILNSDKAKIAGSLFSTDSPDIFSLGPAVDRANPADGTFDKAVRGFILAIGETEVVEPSVALATLEKGVYSTFAGAYASAPTFLITGTDFDPDFGNMIGYGAGADVNKRFLGQFWMVVDRRGRMIGGGLYSYGQISSTDSLASDPQAMDLFGFDSASASERKVWPAEGDLAGLKFTLLGASDAGKSVRITQGVMSRGAIAGSTNLYENLFDESAADASLGEWNLENGGATYIFHAPYTLEHTVAVAPLMNPNLWPDITFPIPLEISIFNNDDTGCAPAKGCEIAKLHVLILKDGNIVSDIHDGCGVNLDPDTLQYPVVAPATVPDQEYPLGVVSNILRGDAPESTLKDENGDPITVMTLLAMLPNNSELINAFAQPGYEQYFPYIQFASNFGLNSLLRVDAGDQNKMYGLCDSFFFGTVQLCDALGSFEPGIAEWTNHYTSARRQYASDNSLPTDALSKNNAGFMTSRRNPACP